jgi:hypothetical protein
LSGCWLGGVQVIVVLPIEQALLTYHQRQLLLDNSLAGP